MQCLSCRWTATTPCPTCMLGLTRTWGPPSSGSTRTPTPPSTCACWRPGDCDPAEVRLRGHKSQHVHVLHRGDVHASLLAASSLPGPCTLKTAGCAHVKTYPIAQAVLAEQQCLASQAVQTLLAVCTHGCQHTLQAGQLQWSYWMLSMSSAVGARPCSGPSRPDAQSWC